MLEAPLGRFRAGKAFLRRGLAVDSAFVEAEILRMCSTAVEGRPSILMKPVHLKSKYDECPARGASNDIIREAGERR